MSAEGGRLRKRDRIPAGKAGGDTVIICPKPYFDTGFMAVNKNIMEKPGVFGK